MYSIIFQVSESIRKMPSNRDLNKIENYYTQVKP